MRPYKGIRHNIKRLLKTTRSWNKEIHILLLLLPRQDYSQFTSNMVFLLGPSSHAALCFNRWIIIRARNWVFYVKMSF